ncbi:hypothetical protein [Couchioplanes azureus]|uniref:hypothetical protein n=1 Tax=Couchioplanes caeruleus TaxID=56438 RepID=UPI0016711E76|nr:hypothetical protein [Couchioplanes caeruleus]GGQ44549.1 hypothetical protein GCM10010166_11370 [Couchioplanes caeruleus subsp. azureus]
MQRRTTALTRALLVPAAIVLGALAVTATTHTGQESTAADRTTVALMPMIGSGTHPVAETVEA